MSAIVVATPAVAISANVPNGNLPDWPEPPGRRTMSPGVAMTYSTGRVVHDADAHIMETPNWLRDHADPAIRERIPALSYPGGNELRQSRDLHESTGGLDAAFERLTARHRSAEYTDAEAEEIMLRKNFAATGSFLA